MSLLTPEAQRDPYVWASVLLAHAAIGIAAFVISGAWLAVVGYAAFEIAQARVSRTWLWWDMLLDACGATLGVVLAAAIWGHNAPVAVACIVAVAGISAAGWLARR